MTRSRTTGMVRTLGIVAAGLAAAAVALAAGCASRDAGMRATALPSVQAPKALALDAKAAAPQAALTTAPGQVAPHPLPERDAPKKPIDYKKAPLIDNSRCYVCHINFEEEMLVRSHAWSGGAGCEKCHGASDDHCGDENHETPPDIMYAKEKIAAACWECHPEVKPPKGFKPTVAEDAKKVCTECHGQHRIEKRIRKWDRVTRKLVVE